MTALFIITSNNKKPKSLNWIHSCLPCTGVNTMADSSQLTQCGSKVRQPCQSTIVGGACAEPHYSDRNPRTAWFEKGVLKQGIKKKHWVYLYRYKMDVYTHFQHTFMFKQLEKWILHPIIFFLECMFLRSVDLMIQWLVYKNSHLLLLDESVF